MTGYFRALGAAALGAAVLTAPAAADPVADFYKGRTVTIVVASESGGAYDLYARLYGNRAGKYVPGDPTFIYQYMPGAGGVKAANYAYNAAPKDGSVIFMGEQGTPLSKVLRNDPGMRFDIAKFNWIGTVAQSYYLIGVTSKAPATTIEAGEPGTEIQASMERLAATPPALVAKLRAALDLK